MADEFGFVDEPLYDPRTVAGLVPDSSDDEDDGQADEELPQLPPTHARRGNAYVDTTPVHLQNQPSDGIQRRVSIKKQSISEAERQQLAKIASMRISGDGDSAAPPIVTDTSTYIEIVDDKNSAGNAQTQMDPEAERRAKILAARKRMSGAISPPSDDPPPPPPSAAARKQGVSEEQRALLAQMAMAGGGGSGGAVRAPPSRQQHSKAAAEQAADGNDSDPEPITFDDDSIYDPMTMAGLGVPSDDDDGEDADASGGQDADLPPPPPTRPSLAAGSRAAHQRRSAKDALPPPPPGAAPLSPVASRQSMPLPPVPQDDTTTGPKPPPLPGNHPALRKAKPDQPVPAELKYGNEVWFHGPLSRPEAEIRLRSGPPGAYLVRTSGSVDGYVVSMVTVPGRYAHVRIIRSEEGKLCTTDRRFDDLFELLKFYGEYSMNSGVALSVPCPKQGF